MADLDGVQDAKNFHTDIPQEQDGFFLKGSNSLDWGMKNRLSQIFDPKSGNTVMLAFDHGYFMGATTGLERIDVSINPLSMLAPGFLRNIFSLGEGDHSSQLPDEPKETRDK